MADEISKLQKAADFGVRMIPLVLKLRRAKDNNEGLTLDPQEIQTLVEIINVLRAGPK